jgi:hypothetical protein
MPVIENALEAMEKGMSPESIERSNQIYLNRMDSMVLYWGIFFDESQFNNLPRKGILGNEVSDKHVTCGFKKGFPLRHRDGDQVQVRVIGYGSDGVNEGYLVEILDPEVNTHYQGAEQKHITLSLGPSGKAVKTAELSFDPLMLGYILTGSISSR